MITKDILIFITYIIFFTKGSHILESSIEGYKIRSKFQSSKFYFQNDNFLILNASYKSNIALEFYPKKDGALPRNLRLIKNPNSKLNMDEFSLKSVEYFWYKKNLTIHIYNIEESVELITIADQNHKPFNIKIIITYIQEENEILLYTYDDNLVLLANELVKITCIRKINYNINETISWKYENNSNLYVTLRNDSEKNIYGFSRLNYLVSEKVVCGQYKCLMGNNHLISINITSHYPDKFCYNKNFQKFIKENFITSHNDGIFITFLCSYAIIVVISRNIFLQ
uniref:Ig-like domain-containing protein n=1 Tax=Strongyloides stercoralis TaxID=6248 RepID=A0A0K0ERB1_STRER